MSKDGRTLKQGNFRHNDLRYRGKMFYYHGPGYILETNWRDGNPQKGAFKIERIGESPFKKIRKGKFETKDGNYYNSTIIVTRWKK